MKEESIYRGVGEDGKLEEEEDEEPEVPPGVGPGVGPAPHGGLAHGACVWVVCDADCVGLPVGQHEGRGFLRVGVAVPSRVVVERFLRLCGGLPADGVCVGVCGVCEK